MHLSQRRPKIHNGLVPGTAREAERIIGLNIRPFLRDLCLTDRSFLVDSIANNSHASINDIVESSCEMFFKPGTLRYGYGFSLVSGFRAAPAPSITMHFAHRAVFVSFRLDLTRDFVGISLVGFQCRNTRDQLALDELAEAFSDARLEDRAPVPSAAGLVYLH